MRRILALDLGTNTGWATNAMLHDVKRRCASRSGVVTFDGEISGWRYLAFKQWLDNKLKSDRIDHVVYEETFSKSAYSSRILHGFLAMVQFTYAERWLDDDRRLTMAKVHANTLKKFATENGHASKDLMISKYREKFGYLPADDDEADALWLLEYAKARIGE